MDRRAPLMSSNQKVKAAWLYHVEGLTQEQIAEQMRLSRVKVMRILAECVAEGLITTRINQIAASQVALERALEKRFGFASAVVFPAAASVEGLEKGLSYAVADVLDRMMVPGMTLAVGSGATLFQSLRHLEPRMLGDGAIIGLVGALAHSGWINPSTVAMRLGERFGVASYQITAPILVDDETLAELLWRQASLRDLHARAMAADVAVLTVGDHRREATVFRHGLVPAEHFDSLSAAGAVANILCRFIDSDGGEVDHPINRCVMSLKMAEVARIPRIVLAAAGAHRLAAIRAAIRAVPVSVFITDEDCAEALIADQP